MSLSHIETVPAAGHFQSPIDQEINKLPEAQTVSPSVTTGEIIITEDYFSPVLKSSQGLIIIMAKYP